jgi:hypothetical protein
MKFRLTLTVAVALAAASPAAAADDAQALVSQMGGLKARAAARPYVVLRRFVCATSGASPEDLESDLREARAVFAACGVDVRAPDAQVIPSDYGSRASCQLGDDRDLKTLTPDQAELFARYPGVDSPDALRVFYLSWRTGPHGATTSGTSFPAEFVRREKGDSDEARRAVGAVVVFHGARRFAGSRYVLAHEMGHVLLDDSAHRKDDGNLMRDWDAGRTLDKAQCLTIRASPFVRR